MFADARIRSLAACLAATLFVCAMAGAAAAGETIARCGKGWLEKENGIFVLHLAGSPREMGYQHGVLMREHVEANMNYLLDVRAKELQFDLAGMKFGPESLLAGIVEAQRKHTPDWYREELAGLAEGSGLAVSRIERANFIPELFHCSGFAVLDSATKDGTLYHGRVLDYAVDWKLQEHAVIIVAQPDDGIASVNVSFAGFIGSVTGMNAAKISIGEMGGRGLGHWDGVPMAILVRQVLREAKSLDDAIAIFRDQPRTCEYFYVVADGNAKRAVGFEASWNHFGLVKPGEKHERLPRPVKDAVLLSAGDRYTCLVDRVSGQHGQIDAAKALGLMDRGVATKGNLHNALFAPQHLQFWVSYAGVDKTPAAERPYTAFDLQRLLDAEPDRDAPLVGE